MGPRGLMDKASDFGSEDCEFESRRGRKYHFFPHGPVCKKILRQRVSACKIPNLIPISKENKIACILG